MQEQFELFGKPSMRKIEIRERGEFWREVFVDGVAVAIGDQVQCDSVVDELRQSEDKADIVYDLFKNDQVSANAI